MSRDNPLQIAEAK